MDYDITRYLNDHLAGSSGASLLIQKLAERHDEPDARDFFRRLQEKVESDRQLLEDLLRRIGKEPSGFLKMAGGIASRFVGIKLMWEQVEPRKLGLFEALEMLALGVQGKRLLWVALMEVADWFPEWEDIDFVELELQAIQQRDDIEFWRIQAALSILVVEDRREGYKELDLVC